MDYIFFYQPKLVHSYTRGNIFGCHSIVYMGVAQVHGGGGGPYPSDLMPWWCVAVACLCSRVCVLPVVVACLPVIVCPGGVSDAGELQNVA